MNIFFAVFSRERVGRDILLRAEAKARNELAYLRNIERIVINDVHFFGREVHGYSLHALLTLHKALKAR